MSARPVVSIAPFSATGTAGRTPALTGVSNKKRAAIPRLVRGGGPRSGSGQTWWARAPAALMTAWQATVRPGTPEIVWSPKAAALRSSLICWPARPVPGRARSAPALTSLNLTSPGVLDLDRGRRGGQREVAELADAGVELLVAGPERGHAGRAERLVRVGQDLGDDPAVLDVVVRAGRAGTSRSAGCRSRRSRGPVVPLSATIDLAAVRPGGVRAVGRPPSRRGRGA